MPAGFEIWLLPAPMALLGLVVGSFLNVVIYRWPRLLERQWWNDVSGLLSDRASHERLFGQPPSVPLQEVQAQLDQQLQALPTLSLSRPRSACPHCQTPIRWRHNLPVLGWLLLRGRCAQCQHPISLRYPAVEATTSALFALAAWRFGPDPASLMWALVLACLLTLSLIDWDTTLLPDDLTLPLLWLGLVAASLGWTLTLPDALLGAVAGYLSLWSVYWVFKLITGKEGMGRGDFKLLAALGAWLGWQALLPIILVASVCGSIVGLGMKATGALREGQYVPFGPFLAAGGTLVLFTGSTGFLSWLLGAGRVV